MSWYLKHKDNTSRSGKFRHSLIKATGTRTYLFFKVGQTRDKGDLARAPNLEIRKAYKL